MTKFEQIYDVFLGKITDDMYLMADDIGWTREDTLKDMQNILRDSIPGFEFPRFDIYNYNISDLILNEDGEIEDASYFADDLTSEEINILAILMMNTWLQRQITSIENIRMKYSGTDFKFTSQANHLSKLINLKAEIERQDRHMQRLYKRRIRKKDGLIYSNWGILLKDSSISGN